jgi:ribosomal subunit interface protein
MQVNFHQKNIHLRDDQKDYISGKLEMLTKFKVMEDPSVVAKVDVEYFENASSDKKIQLAVTVTIPGSTLRAEEASVSVEEGIDLIEEKLRHQLEKYKTVHE